MNIRSVRVDVDVDALVVGAGPAGVALALRLRRLGYEVLLVSPKTPSFRNSHELETFTPAAQNQLRVLGLRAALQAGYRGHVESEICWRTDHFEARAPIDLVDRSAFFGGLRECALDADVLVWDGTVKAIEQTECSWSVVLTSPEGPKEVKTRSVVDATGRRGLYFSRSLRGPALVAIHASWSGKDLPRKIRIAAGPSGWVWGVPAGDGQRYLTTAFQDPRDAKLDSKNLIERVKKAVLETSALQGASRVVLMEVTGVSDATPQSKEIGGAREFFRVGDAVLTLDPVSSSGVQSALQSSIDTALAIHTLRVDPMSTKLVGTFLRRRLERRRARHATWAAAFYREGAARFSDAFWTERAAIAAYEIAEPDTEVLAPLPPPDQLVVLDSAVSIEREPCAIGDLIELRKAIAHPNLPEPVAFVEGIEVPNLLARVVWGSKAESVVRDWSECVGRDSAIKIFSWAWRNRLVSPTILHVA